MPATCADAAGTKIVVLVTDGEETCGGDPAAAIRALAAQGIDVHVNIVGFALDDEALKAQFREWARLGNGQFFDAARSADARPVDRRGRATPVPHPQHRRRRGRCGLVDGDPVEVPPGTYSVEVLAGSLSCSIVSS